MADRHRQSAFAEFVLEQLAGVSGVGKRAMFGGFGIYRDGLMFALANDHLAEDFIALGLPPFAFMSKGKTVALKYYRAPESVFEDSDQMRHWADKAYRCALRNAETKAGPKRSNRR
jgi:DNA transformation protein and related proteins